MCRLAVAEAEAQIGGVVVPTQPSAVSSGYAEILPADNEGRGAVPMTDG